MAICTKKQKNTEKLKKHLKKRGKSILAPSTLNPKKCLCGFRVCSSANNKREKIEKKELVEKGGSIFLVAIGTKNRETPKNEKKHWKGRPKSILARARPRNLRKKAPQKSPEIR